MSVYVFLGPTLPVADARQVLDAVYLPPARQGDVYRLTQLRRPTAIGLVDGHFNQVPAVWHKEILWAISAGIAVYGAASMGALRAAELAPFGMRGVGRVFEAYRDGVLPPYGGEPFEDDDEVAVIHAPGEAGYRPLSEAMVNIRCSLAAAADAAVIGKTTRDRLLHLAKELFYPERSYQRLLQRAASLDLPRQELRDLAEWLPTGRRDQKREDALRLLQVIEDELRGPPAANTIKFRFQHTVQWQSAMAEVGAAQPPTPAVLVELRLQGAPYLEARRAALARLLALAPPSPGQRPLEVLARELGLPTGDQLDRVLGEHHDQPDEVESLWRKTLQRAGLEAAVADLPVSLLERHLMDWLRECGDYPRLQARAECKRQLLASLRPPPAATELSGLEALQLQDWYFDQRLGRAIPADLEAYVASLGFADLAAFNQAILAEYVYLDLEQRGAEGG